jgi:hypothetical protein
VLLALIGARWAGEDTRGKVRISDPQDWVHVEVATALRRGITVIPVLLDGTRMPAAENLPGDLQSLARMNAADVRASRLNADVWDLTGATMSALREKWPPDEPGGKIYAMLAALYAFFAGAVLLFVMIASMFGSLGVEMILGTSVFLLNALVLLRLPIHSRVRTLTRQQALRIGAVVHLIGFAMVSAGDASQDGVIIFVFGITPAALLFLASFAMRRLVRS